jgi:outer membrane immunogenic protein
MKRVSYVSGAALLCALAWAAPSAARAAGGPWSGFYVGGNLGDAFNPSSLNFHDLSDEQDLTFRDDNSGDRLIGGLHTGYGWWMGNLYGGVEGDVDWAKHIDYLASVRGRLGFGSERWLVYGTAGVGFIGTKQDFTAISADEGPSRFSRSFHTTGFVGGAGVDYALSHNLSLGVEGLWYAFGSDRHTLTTPFDESFTVRSDNNFGAVRARLTWWLNG